MSLPTMNNTTNGNNDCIQLVNKHYRRHFERPSVNNLLYRHQNYSIVRFIHSLNLYLRLLIEASKALPRLGALFLILTLSSVQFAHADQSADIDKELNVTYQQALKIAVNPKLLRQSQRYWLKYADAYCIAAKSNSDEPEAASGWEQSCIDELKEHRTNQLKTHFISRKSH